MRHLWVTVIAAVAVALTACAALALSPVQSIVLFGAPSWVKPQTTLDCRFGSQGCWVQGSGNLPFSSLFTITRASPAKTYASDTSGNLIPFAANQPRITNKGLLVEMSQTNLLKQSQFAASWTPQHDVTLTANAALSPDNTNDAATLVENTTAGVTHYTQQGVTKAASAVTYIASIYASRLTVGSARDLLFQVYDSTGGNGAQAIFTLSNGSVLTSNVFGTGFTILDAHCDPAANNYWHCDIDLTSNSDTSIYAVPILWNTSGGTETYTGDGVSGINVYGAQLEAQQAAIQGPQLRPSSYIPTTTAAVTRSADIISVSAGSLLTQMLASNNFSWYAKFIQPSFQATGVPAGEFLLRYTLGDTYWIEFYTQSLNSNSGLLWGAAYSSTFPSGQQFESNNTGATGTVLQAALSLAPNNGNAAFSVDGATIHNINTLVMQSAVGGSIYVGSAENNQYLNSYLQEIAWASTNVSNPQLLSWIGQ